MTQTNSDHDAALDEAIDRARVVLFVSNLTDARPVIHGLEANGVPYHVEHMGMGNAAMRERFHQLERRTGWQTLPQVFIDGDLVGGIEEALTHPLITGAADPDAARVWARSLGYAGLIPFAALTALVLFAPGAAPGAERMLAGYGAVILSFLGALHWGWTLAGGRSTFSVPASLSWGVAPAILAWLSLALATPAALGLQAVLLIAAYGVDRRAWARQPDTAWLLRLRAVLSTTAAVLLAAAAVATL
ncbi:DUF3429 family protein [Thiohalorhabdus sp.]|uniref:DUF3429 family protein n=1 Tax=Thiohalorhabdus sp. TaxID=3094134 RepID=UPI002FC3ABA8